MAAKPILRGRQRVSQGCGTTILTPDAAGLIESNRLYHRLLQIVVEFSKELGFRNVV
jgi:hypothetical protein